MKKGSFSATCKENFLLDFVILFCFQFPAASLMSLQRFP